MRKITIVLMMALLAAFGNANAQYEKGNIDVNVGFGLGSTIGAGKTQLPPLSLSVDYGYSDQISIGGYLGYTSSKDEFPILNYSWKFSYLIIGVRGAYHLDLVENLDTYAGVMLGYNIASAKFEGSLSGIPEPKVGGIAYSGFAGARYHFNEKLGVFGELGYGISFLNLGLTMKL